MLQHFLLPGWQLYRAFSVLGQLPFLMVLVLCQLTCSGGLVDLVHLLLI